MADHFDMSGTPMVVMSKDEYDSLIDDVNMLVCLEAAGVDNWEGYSEAVAMMSGED